MRSFEASLTESLFAGTTARCSRPSPRTSQKPSTASCRPLCRSRRSVSLSLSVFCPFLDLRRGILFCPAQSFWMPVCVLRLAHCRFMLPDPLPRVLMRSCGRASSAASRPPTRDCRFVFDFELFGASFHSAVGVTLILVATVAFCAHCCPRSQPSPLSIDLGVCDK